MNPSSSPPVSAVHSRRWVLGAAVTAGLAGVGASWWHHRAGGEADDPALEALWAQTLDSPAGSPLALSGFKGKRLVLNFWATWCPPCVEELPMLNRFHQAQQSRGWSVLGLAVDQPSAVRGFLQKTPLGFPVALAGLQGADLSRSLGNVSGGLPFTVLVHERGNIIQRKLGKLSEDDLTRWATLA